MEMIMSEQRRFGPQTFFTHFENMLQQEIDRVDLSELRRPGVLLARSFAGPVIVAFCKAVRLAFRPDGSAAQAASTGNEAPSPVELRTAPPADA
jgi:hypothetical protein